MSATVETCFVTRVPAWHKIGIVLPESPTAEDAIVAAGLDWEVAGCPIYTTLNDEKIKIPNYVANVRNTDNTTLGVVSDRYRVIQNKDAFSFVDSLCEEGELTFESAGSLEHGKQIWLLAHTPTKKILDDDFEPYICFTNRHDGMGSVRCIMTPTRVVCQNTLNLALSGAKRSWSARHIGNIEGKIIEAQETLGLIDNYMEALNVEADRLASTKISDAAVERILDIAHPIALDASDTVKRHHEEFKEQFFICLGAKDISQYKGSAYAVVNAITDYADHIKPGNETYSRNRWAQIINNGIPVVDSVYREILKVA